MDIAGPLMNEQPSPPPPLWARRHVDMHQLVRNTVSANPQASGDEIGHILRKKGYQVPGVLIAAILQKMREQDGSG